MNRGGVTINQKYKIIKFFKNHKKKWYNSSKGRDSSSTGLSPPISQERKQQKNKLRDVVVTTSQAPATTHIYTDHGD